MSKVLNKQTIPVFQYRHNWRYVSNRAYAINAVDKAISRKQYTIVLDPSKLKTKQYTSTEVFLYDREGQPLKIETDYIYGKNNKQFDLLPNGKKTYIIQGVSWPQHGDRFSKAEGRKYALIDAVSQLQIIPSDPNYKDLLELKLFLQQFEVRAKNKHPHWDWPNVLITWQYIDLWNALLTAKFISSNGLNVDSTEVVNAAIALVGQANYDELFSLFIPELLDFFCNGEEFNKKHKENTIEAAYYFYSKAIAQYNEDLSYASVQHATNNLTTDDLVEDLQDTLQG